MLHHAHTNKIDETTILFVWIQLFTSRSLTPTNKKELSKILFPERVAHPQIKN